jgi:hypothetical protein
LLIYNREPQGFIEVWMTNEEQETIDRKALTAQILADAGHPKKCKVVYFLSGSADLTECMSSLLRKISDADLCTLPIDNANSQNLLHV